MSVSNINPYYSMFSAWNRQVNSSGSGKTDLASMLYQSDQTSGSSKSYGLAGTSNSVSQGNMSESDLKSLIAEMLEKFSTMFAAKNGQASESNPLEQDVSNLEDKINSLSDTDAVSESDATDVLTSFKDIISKLSNPPQGMPSETESVDESTSGSSLKDQLSALLDKVNSLSDNDSVTKSDLSDLLTNLKDITSQMQKPSGGQPPMGPPPMGPPPTAGTETEDTTSSTSTSSSTSSTSSSDAVSSTEDEESQSALASIVEELKEMVDQWAAEAEEQASEKINETQNNDYSQYIWKNAMQAYNRPDFMDFSTKQYS
ncbi:MAG: hypothetical protein ACM3MK_06830 [Chitinophagales bacterium]